MPFSVEIGIESEQSLNAYSILATYQPEFLEFSGASDGGSIIDIWQKRPELLSGGVIGFNGGSFKPLEGGYGKLVTLNFIPLKEGTASITLPDSIVYRADGAGTPQSPLPLRLTFQIASGGAGDRGGAGDSIPPEISFSEVVPDPFEQNRKLLSFRVSDSGSGVKETLVRSRSFILWGAWQAAENPVLLPAMAWAVHLRAVDQRGNVSEMMLYDWTAFLRLIFLVSILVAIGFVARIHL
ncbi:hypothetical protein C4571_01650 [Candidatus Parcubacteria bacterium]|nr:MAG: hypothetical protein C4571_01650 [Candidatus Parcubacteria bacterium]